MYGPLLKSISRQGVGQPSAKGCVLVGRALGSGVCSSGLNIGSGVVKCWLGCVIAGLRGEKWVKHNMVKGCVTVWSPAAT